MYISVIILCVLSMICFCDLASPPTIFRHGDRLRVLPAVLAEILLEGEQSLVEFSKSRDICIVGFAVEEVKHGFHLFRVSPSLACLGPGELDGPSNHFRKRIGKLGLSQRITR